jgi:TIR domain
VPASNRVFISHAAADRQLAGMLRDTLILGGVPESQLFYSSSRSSGIASGSDIRSDLHEQLHKAGMIVELISSVYLRRPMCLIEHGAAWALGKSTYPIVVPPLERDVVEQQLGSIHMGLLGGEQDLDDVLDELHDRLASDVGVNTKAASWNRATRYFKNNWRIR